MGFFVNLRGRFECIRCGHVDETPIQTKLLHADRDNTGTEYRVGDSEILDGEDELCPLFPRTDPTWLVAAVGPWDCNQCHCDMQWARAEFAVSQVDGKPTATLRALPGLRPYQAADLAGIHLVHSDLATLANWLSAPSERLNWREWERRWLALSIPERCEQMAAGFRRWCREVFEVPDHP